MPPLPSIHVRDPAGRTTRPHRSSSASSFDESRSLPASAPRSPIVPPATPRSGKKPLALTNPIQGPMDLVVLVSAAREDREAGQAMVIEILQRLGDADRVALVAFMSGAPRGNAVRGTPLLCPAKAASRSRLRGFVETFPQPDAVADPAAAVERAEDLLHGRSFSPAFSRASRDGGLRPAVITLVPPTNKLDRVIARAAPAPARPFPWGASVTPVWLVPNET